jgi:hypothetical protein
MSFRCIGMCVESTVIVNSSLVLESAAKQHAEQDIERSLVQTCAQSVGYRHSILSELHFVPRGMQYHRILVPLHLTGLVDSSVCVSLQDTCYMIHMKLTRVASVSSESLWSNPWELEYAPPNSQNTGLPLGRKDDSRDTKRVTCAFSATGRRLATLPVAARTDSVRDRDTSTALQGAKGTESVEDRGDERWRDIHVALSCVETSPRLPYPAGNESNTR